jgi:histidinol-phosphatase (PHP family)
MASMTNAAPDTGPVGLPLDSHVHSQWSWDALAGSMKGTCQRAVQIGLPAVAFTEHADFTLVPAARPEGPPTVAAIGQ